MINREIHLVMHDDADDDDEYESSLPKMQRTIGSRYQVVMKESSIYGCKDLKRSLGSLLTPIQRCIN